MFYWISFVDRESREGDAQEAWLQVCSPHFSEGRLLLERFGLILGFVGEFRDVQETFVFF